MTQKETALQKKEARMAAELARVQQMRDFELEAVRRAGFTIQDTVAAFLALYGEGGAGA